MPMPDEQIKERVKYYTEWLRLFWVAIVGLAGGISGLVLALDSPIRAFLLALAISLGIGVAVIVFLLHRAIVQLIGQIQGGKP